MKKVILSLAAIFAVGAVSAQDVYKPQAGNVSTELGLSGGIFNSTTTLPDVALFKARYFKDNSTAYRASFSLNSSSETKNIDFKTDEKTADETHTTGKDNAASTGFLVGFGLEKHFFGTERLSPYIGGEVLLGYNSNSKTEELTTVNSGSNKTAYNGSYIFEEKRGSFNFGVRGVFGADYYFVKNVFVGVEAGLGLYYTANGETKKSSTTTVTTGGTTNSTITNSTTPGGSTFNITPGVVTGVRIGYTF